MQECPTLPPNISYTKKEITLTILGMEKQAHYVLYRDKKGGYRFRLVAPNGEVVATSESYTTRRGMMNSVEKMAMWAATTHLEEIKSPKKKAATR